MNVAGRYMHTVSMVHLFLCSDQNNVLGLAVTVRSAIERLSEPCTIHILYTGISYKEQVQLRESWKKACVAQIHFHKLDPARVSPFRATMYLRSKFAYARLFVGEYLSDVDRCIYLDTDLIVFDDLAELHHVSLRGHVVGAVRDISVRTTGSDGHIAALRQRLKLKDPSRYFNSGVMAWDLSGWREQDLEDRCVQIGLEWYDVLHSQDQDILNVALENNWAELDAKWNVSQYEAPQNISDGVLHLIGQAKPWHADYDYKFKDLFFDILDRTMYKGTRPQNLLGLGPYYNKARRRVPSSEMLLRQVRLAVGDKKA